MSITVGIASIPNREPNLKEAIKRFLPEVDKINVSLDSGYVSVPEYLYDDKIEVFEKNLFGDAGKFVKVPEDGIYLSVDDDIIYPVNYIPEILKGIEKYGLVTFHGSILKQPFKRYYRDRWTFPFHHTLKHDRPVQVGGTGVMGFDCEYFRPKLKWFDEANMADIFVSLKAKELGKEIWCLAHESYWIGQQKTNGQSIAQRFFLNDEIQTTFARELLN